MAEETLAAVPRHLAVIMDGNGRWAERRRLPRAAGHRAGVKAARRVVREAAQQGVRVLTLFAFSSENWFRPATEVGLLMDLFLHTLRRQVEELSRNNIRVRFIGDHSEFPTSLCKEMRQAQLATRDNDGMDLVVAVGYGGRWDILQAACAVVSDVAAGRLSNNQIGTQLARRLSLASLPDPDLFLRTGGEYRISNFLLWNLAYTELYFTDVLWPDFDHEQLRRAFAWFAGRQRRFGRVSNVTG